MIPPDAARYHRVAARLPPPPVLRVPTAVAGHRAISRGTGRLAKASSPRLPSTLPTVQFSVRCRMSCGHTRNRWQHGLSCPRLGRSAAEKVWAPFAAIQPLPSPICDLPAGWGRIHRGTLRPASSPSGSSSAYHQAGWADFRRIIPSPQAKRMASQMSRLSLSELSSDGGISGSRSGGK